MPNVAFDQIRDSGDVAVLWGIGLDDLVAIATSDRRALYESFQIPKKGAPSRGQFRTVHKPVSDALAQFQKNLGRDIGETVPFPDYVQGFVRGRSAVSNATRHLAAPALLHLDIAGFFDAITMAQVEAAFITLGCRPAVSTLLSRVCTLDDRLPQGASTSPVIANLVCAGLDTALNQLAAARSCLYSRYADDIVISGARLPDPAAVSRVIESHGFRVQTRKVRTQHRGRSQFVTGLSVSHPGGVRAPKVMKHRLRLELHYAATYGITAHLNRARPGSSPWKAIARWEGWLNYLDSIEAEKPTARRLRALLDGAKI